MTRLVKGVFDEPVARAELPLFGLRSSHMACSEIVHNGGWYNLAGEKLGWGDLAARDFIRLMAELQGDEAFLVIGEQASFWYFSEFEAKRQGTVGLDPTVPGLDYVLKHLRWAVLPNVAYFIDGLHKGGPATGREWLGLRNYVSVTRDWMIGELRQRGLLPPALG